MDAGAFLNELMLSQLYNIFPLSANVEDAWVKWSDQFNSVVNRHVYPILISDMHVQNKKYANFVFMSRLTGKCATQTNLKFTQF